MNNLILTTMIVLLMSYLIPGIVVTSLFSAIIFAALLGLLNATLGRLIKFVGCAINLLTLGLFNLLVNATIIMLVDKVLNGIYINGFLTALILAFILSIFTTHSQDQQNRQRR